MNEFFPRVPRARGGEAMKKAKLLVVPLLLGLLILSGCVSASVGVGGHGAGVGVHPFGAHVYVD
jgi:hypothetical protein